MVGPGFPWLLLFAALAALTGCAGDGFLTPARHWRDVKSAPASQAVPEYHGPATRPFYMGFTLWPADLSDAGVAMAREYAQAHGDIVSVTFIGGIPWPEALAGKPFSKDVQTSLSGRPSGSKLFLSISPLNKDKRGLAPYWGETDNLPLPRPWNAEPLNSPRVKRAYLNFVLRAVKAMRPDYLAIGVESNVLLSRDRVKWRQLKELHRDTYIALKRVHRSLPVFFTTDVLHYRGLTPEAKGTHQEKEVADLMRYSDLFAMSFYPYLSPQVPRPLPSRFLDFAKRFRKGIAISESGMISRSVDLSTYGMTLYGSENDQKEFTEFLLKTAARDEYEFVINFATTDSERLVARLRPPLADRAKLWAYIGMQASDRRPKPASTVWDGFLGAKYAPAKWW